MTDAALLNFAEGLRLLLAERHPEYAWIVKLRQDHPRALLEPCQAEVVEPDGPASC